MSKKKNVFLALLFMLILLVTTNVNAVTVNYGQRKCNGKVWSPDNPCDGTNYEVIDNALTIDFGNNGHVTGVKTDLFGSGIRAWIELSDALKYTTSPLQVGIYKQLFDVDLNTWMKKQQGVYVAFSASPGLIAFPLWLNENINSIETLFTDFEASVAGTILSLIEGSDVPDVIKNLYKNLSQGINYNDVYEARSEAFAHIVRSMFPHMFMYVHNYQPLIEYYRSNGVPKNVIAVKTSFTLTLFESSLGGYMYTYYPSDLQIANAANIEIAAYSYVNLVASSIVLFWKNYSDGSVIDILKKSPLFVGHTVYSILNVGSQYFTYDQLQYYTIDPGSSEVDLNSCDDLDALLDRIAEVRKNQGTKSQSYIQLVEKAMAYCERYRGSRNMDADSACYDKCVNLNSILAGEDPSIFNKTNECNISQDMAAWLMRILKIARYLVPVIVIVLSTVEYVGAIISADDDAMKKVGAKFSKRLFIMILIFVLPSLLQFIFNIFNIDGLNDTNPYCLNFK